MYDQTKTEFQTNETTIDNLVNKHLLEKCKKGDTVYFQSPKEAQLLGIFMQTKGNELEIKCSLHKQYNKKVFGSLDNTGQFTMSNANYIARELVSDFGVDWNKGIVKYFEIGLNIITDRPPIEYIELIRSIGNDGEKEYFNDANYKKNRQKTTEKSKYIRKFFKVYDKGFELSDRKRQPHENDPYILRVETVYRRQKIKVSEFFSKEYVNKITNKFLKDWQSVVFERTMKAAKGTRPSQQARAKQILLLGIDGYKSLISEQLKKGLLTEVGYRTAREFVRDWNEYKKNYLLIPSELEEEFINKFNMIFKVVSEMTISS